MHPRRCAERRARRRWAGRWARDWDMRTTGEVRGTSTRGCLRPSQDWINDLIVQPAFGQPKPGSSPFTGNQTNQNWLQGAKARVGHLTEHTLHVYTTLQLASDGSTESLYGAIAENRKLGAAASNSVRMSYCRAVMVPDRGRLGGCACVPDTINAWTQQGKREGKWDNVGRIVGTGGRK